MSKRARIGARAFQISNFRGDIQVADPHVVRQVGAQETRYWKASESLRRIIRNLTTVLLQLRSVTKRADFGPRTFWRRPMYTRPRIHVEKGAIRGPKFPNLQHSGKYPRGGPHDVRHVGAKETRYCQEGSPSSD